MRIKFYSIYCFVLLNVLGQVLSPKIFAREELQIVQTVSQTKKSFVLNKGLAEGIYRGMELLVSNEQVSILCKAIEVNRQFSLWSPVSANVSIPFQKEEIVTINPYAYGNVALNVDKIQFPDLNSIPKIAFVGEHYWSLYYNYTFGLYQTTSDVSAENSGRKTGSQLGLEYIKHFHEEFEWTLGGRFGREVYRLNDGGLDVQTDRYLMTVVFNYLLKQFSSGKGYWSLGLLFGAGLSSTLLDETTSRGPSFLLPEIRLGYNFPFSNGNSLQLEFGIENLINQEKFDDGEEQSNNTVNSKFTVGIRF